MLRRAVQRRPYDWEQLLPSVLQAYRSTPLKPLASRRTVLHFSAKFNCPSTSVRHSQNRRATSELLQTISSRTWNGHTASPVECPALNIVARKAVIMSASSKSCPRPAFMSTSFSMDVISAPHRHSFPHIVDSVKSSKSEDQFLICASWTRQTTTPFAFLLSDHHLVLSLMARPQHHAAPLVVRAAPGSRKQCSSNSSRCHSGCFPQRHSSAANC